LSDESVNNSDDVGLQCSYTDVIVRKTRV